MPKKKPVVPSVKRMLRDIATPDGFDRNVHQEPATKWFRAFWVLELTTSDVKVSIDFSGDRTSFALANGHVSFKAPDGWRSYDRYGVEDSFYISNPLMDREPGDPIAQTNEVIRRFIEERIPESLARIARSESVPGIPFSVTPEQKVKISKKLRAGQTHSFMPSGFGTGYTLSPKSDRYSTPDAKLKKFFGVGVWVSTFDAD